ncbi:carboxypeptidase-like regulatory domain-containing protein [Flindersiella endophytica]
MRAIRIQALATAGLTVALATLPASAQAAEITTLPAWGTVASPTVGEFTNGLTGVYAASPTQAWAVGSAVGRADGGGQETRTMLQRWNGTTWSQVTAPTLPDGRVAALNAVDGTGPNDVWAVGAASTRDDFGADKTVTMHWDGQSWTVVPSPDLGFLDDVNRLHGVVAIAPNDVWAVGEYAQAPYFTQRQSILLHWNGTAWRAVDHPCAAGLRSLDAASAGAVWAIGGSAACYFNGSAWTAARPAPPPVPDRTLLLSDVAVLSPTEAWAVGRISIPCGENVCSAGEIQRWNGAQWTRFTTFGLDVSSVHAIAANDIWASTDDGMLHFDGQTWTRVPAPAGVRAAVAASGPGDIWAVGSTNGGSPSKGLIQHAPAFGTGTVVGETNHADALISWTGETSGSVRMRNSFGEYEIVTLPAGTYQLFATAPGCSPLARPVVVGPGQILREDFTLSC